MSGLTLSHIVPELDIHINQGHQWSTVFKLKDSTGAVVPLTGKSIEGQVRQTKDGPVLFSFIVSINETTNEFTMTIPHIVTAAITTINSEVNNSLNQFVFDWTITDELANQYKIMKGRLLIDKEVTTEPIVIVWVINSNLWYDNGTWYDTETWQET